LGWEDCCFQEINALKQDNRLDLPWDFLEEGEWLLSYDYENIQSGYARVSVDPIDRTSSWIDEFEIIRDLRKKGIGKKAIMELINLIPGDIKIMAKNKMVQQFWEKCGFEDDGITWAEIPMIYKKNS